MAEHYGRLVFRREIRAGLWAKASPCPSSHRFSNHDRQSAIKANLRLFARGAFDSRFVRMVGSSDPLTKKHFFI